MFIWRILTFVILVKQKKKTRTNQVFFELENDFEIN